MGENVLRDLQNKRDQLRDDLRKVEDQIFDLETVYLEETATTGNIIRGWDSRQTKAQGSQFSQKKYKFNLQDRMFSYSSTSSKIVQDEMPSSSQYSQNMFDYSGSGAKRKTGNMISKGGKKAGISTRKKSKRAGKRGAYSTNSVRSKGFTSDDGSIDEDYN